MILSPSDSSASSMLIAFCLEYDSDRAGGFEPLRFLPAGKTAVLGLVTTKEGTLESKDELLRRIDQAARVRPRGATRSQPCMWLRHRLRRESPDSRRSAPKLELLVDVAQTVWSGPVAINDER